MVAFNDVQAQLVGLKTKAGFLGIPEVKKLAFLLDPGENILICKKGWVNKKSTLLCVTDKKIAFIDVRSRQHMVGNIPFSQVTSVFRTDGRIATTVRIHTSTAALHFVVLSAKNAKQLQATIGRHLSYLQGTITQTRKAYKPIVVRDIKSWRKLVAQVGSASVSN